MEAHLIFQSRYSNKFWKISVAKTSFAVIYGRIGTAGTMKVKDFSSPEACKREAHRLIQSKLKKGYQPSVASHPEIEESAMTESRFWELLKECKEHGDDAFSQLEWLVSYLSQKSVTDIISFDSFLNEHFSNSHTLKVRAAAFIVMRGCSAEVFNNFRAWMLSLGKDAYYKAVEDPESLLPHLKLLKEQNGIPQFEKLSTAASTAYEVKTGSGFDDYIKMYNQLMLEDSCEPKNSFDWNEKDEESLPNLFPSLWEVFGQKPF